MKTRATRGSDLGRSAARDSPHSRIRRIAAVEFKTLELSPSRRARLPRIAKNQDERFETTIRKAMLFFNGEPVDLFNVITWKELIKRAKKGEPDERTFRSNERLTSHANAIIEQITLDKYSRQIQEILNEKFKGSNKGLEFLLLCSQHEDKPKSISGSFSDSELNTSANSDNEDSEVANINSGTSSFITNGNKTIDMEIEGEKENVAINRRQTRGQIKAQQQIPLGLKPSQPCEYSNHSVPSNNRIKQCLPDKFYANTNRSSSFSSDNDNIFRPIIGIEDNLNSRETSLPNPCDDDEIIENDTPPQTPLNGIDTNGDIIPRKRSRLSSFSRDFEKTSVLTRNRTRSDTFIQAPDSDLSTKVKNVVEIGVVKHIGCENSAPSPASSSFSNYKDRECRDYLNLDLPDLDPPDSGRDKENLPKSEQEILRDYPKPSSCPELRPFMFEEMEEALSRPRKEKVVNAFGLTLKQEQLSVYNKSEWLEDSNIDFYLAMIRDRNNKVGSGYPKVFIFMSFFYKLLDKNGYAAVKETTGTDNIFEFELVLIPIHCESHWILVVIDFCRKSLICYDSMDHSHRNERHLMTIAGYLRREWKEVQSKFKDGNGRTTRATKPPFLIFDNDDELSSDLGPDWKVASLSASDIPQQKNGRDCGIFCLQFAEYLARRHPFDFEQKHTAYFRKRMLYETLKKSLMIT